MTRGVYPTPPPFTLSHQPSHVTPHSMALFSHALPGRSHVLAGRPARANQAACAHPPPAVRGGAPVPGVGSSCRAKAPANDADSNPASTKAARVRPPVAPLSHPSSFTPLLLIPLVRIHCPLPLALIPGPSPSCSHKNLWRTEG